MSSFLLSVSLRPKAANNVLHALRDAGSVCGFGFAHRFDFLIWAIFMQYTNINRISAQNEGLAVETRCSNVF